jgi:hypothetical protein
MLVNILSWPRDHDSENEKMFCDWMKRHLSLKHAVRIHQEGAFSVTIPIPAEKGAKPSSTLFSCHVDTASDRACKTGERKRLAYDPNFGTIFLEKDSPGGCLGADDGAGVWLMLKMIEQNKPGTYLFHRGEERGGISARAIASKEVPWISQFELAVAFDRPRTNEIITHQGSMECASQKFAKALCAELNKHSMEYKPSDRGVYTDTKEYRRLVAECINVGVGYEGQHGRAETQDYAHLCALLTAILAVDWDALPVDRDPTKPDPAPSYAGWKGWTSPGRQSSFDDLEDYDVPVGNGTKKGGKAKKAPAPPAPVHTVSTAKEIIEEMDGMTIDDIRYVLEESPDDALLIMIELMRQRNRLVNDVIALETLLGV